MRRSAAVWGVCLLLAGCTSNRDHVAELADAKCGRALHYALHLTSFDTGPVLSKVHVTTINGGRRVDGMFAQRDTPTRPFVCDVAPDRSDNLRGLRVTRLEFGAPRPSGG